MTMKEGSTVAVFGVGAIGLGVISTARKIGASRIIAIDINPGKEAWAKKFGASDFVNAANLKEGQKVQDVVIGMTDGGCDFTFDCTGNVNDEVS
jgi:S-(hydroxymethyl)glutathione dehydrogenase/alcohol dehydrogenase